MASINTSTDNVQPSQSPSTEQPQLDDVDYTANTATTPMSQSSITAIHSRTPSSDDPQTQLIFTLRGQIQDLFTQVTQLNSKLVKSYDRVSDLEDDLHITQSNLRQSTLKVSQLELERTQHLSALNTGLLVERSNVVEELTRLMERATQEAAQRSSAESAKRNIETELEELSKDLFEGANGMVAEARYERFLSEKRAAESERRVREVEEQLDVMQQEMRRLDKGKWVPRAEELVKERTLMSSHVPYQEFLGFVGHLRGLHGQNGQPAPVMNTLLSLPFLTRIATEDSDPTLRLDLAPSLNWLSRRSVLAAIHNGCLVVESMPSSVFLHQLSQRQQRQGSTGFNLNNLSITVGSGGSGSAGTSHNTVSCALCGTNIFPGLDAASSSSQLQSAIQPTGTWPTSISLFRKGSSASLRASQTSQGITPPPSPPLPSKAKAVSGVNSSVEITQEQTMPGQVYIFRIISTSASSTSASTTTTNTNMSMNLTAAPSAPPPLHSPVTQAVPTRRGRSGTVSQSPFATKVSKPSSSFQPSFTSQFSSQSSSTPPPSNVPGLNENTGSASTGNSTNTGSNAGTIYPLCTSTWCLTRLQATCEIWAFVKSGVVEKVWEEDVLPLSSPTTHNASSGASSNMPEPPPVHPSQHSHAHTTSTSAPASAPPIPPRKRGLWGTLESLSERAASWGGSSQSGSRPGTPSTEEKEKKLPVLPAAPPPLHPSIASDKQNPILESGPGAESSTTNAPPPLPKRSEGRVRPSSTSTPLNPVAPAATQSDAQPASDVNADLPREHNEGNTHTGPEEEFPASQHHPSVHSPIPIAIQEPTKLPLPESRPSTPVTTGLSVGSRPGTPSTKPPSRPSTPNTRTEGVPPPLPRRAVTRGPRPMSTRKPSRSPGPLAADVSRTEEVIKEERESDDVDEKLDEKEKVAQDTDAVSNSMQEDGMAEDASAEEKEKEKQEGQEQGQGEKIEAAVDGTEDIREHDGTKAKGHDNETETTTTTTTTTDNETTPAANVIEATNASGEVKGISGSPPDSEKRVPLLYTAVGDATWEERTWREIVRLKEVMFWARVGGMESS
ncbi:hypothetical protein DFJ43DRAFT_1108069 [Lentinula guzmanii]|uniref:GDP/GTP exchange factor Sec2 N-terminal domain-containing protein n=1 Tax=Lentinula guzmanii TaxID=2804957 RepID=A0AA38MUY2_9AGAR|nr:hypothetical protein DFJ43DRAFT_1108069 [Lentinula guzmanii]